MTIAPTVATLSDHVQDENASFLVSGTAGREHMSRSPLFPVVIGITGHRDIDTDMNGPVATALRAVLTEWKQRFPGAVQVMTALAQGGDQLAADIAKSLDIPRIAVLPMNFDLYYRTMTDDESRAKLTDHWCGANLRLILPKVDYHGPERQEDVQYEQLGVLLARRSHLLLALWDGEPDAKGRGGTAAVVRMRLRGDYRATAFSGSPMFHGAYSILDTAERGPLLQIVADRRERRRDAVIHGTDFPAAPRNVKAGDCLLWAGASETVESAGHRLLRPALSAKSSAAGPILPGRIYSSLSNNVKNDFAFLDDLNRWIGRFFGREQSLLEQQISYLDTEGAPDSISWRLHFLKCLQAGADTAAQVYQQRLLGHFSPAASLCGFLSNAMKAAGTPGTTPHPGLLSVFALVAPLAVLFFEHYVQEPNHPTGSIALFLYIALFSIMLILSGHWLKNNPWQDYFQDYRSLAEAMRVQLYWSLSGVTAAVSDHYLRKQTGELGAIQFALRGPALWGAAVADTLPRPCTATVTRGWILDQAHYFADKAPLHNLADLSNRRWSKALIGLGLLAATALWFHHIMPETTPWIGAAITEECRHLIATAAAVLPALAAALTISREVRAYEPQAHSYASMHWIFSKAANEAAMPDRDDNDFRELVLELGKEALAENAEWLAEHRHRPIELKSA